MSVALISDTQVTPKTVAKKLYYHNMFLYERSVGAVIDSPLVNDLEKMVYCPELDSCSERIQAGTCPHCFQLSG